MSYVPFSSWNEVLSYVDAGAWIFYHAPMDYRPIRVRAKRAATWRSHAAR